MRALICYRALNRIGAKIAFKDARELDDATTRSFASAAACWRCWLQSHAQAQPAARDAFPNRPVKTGRAVPAGRADRSRWRGCSARSSPSDGASRWWSRTAPAAIPRSARSRSRSRAPDGYTLLVAMDTTLVMNPITTKNLPYDALKDFAPISLTAQNTSLLIVRADGPADGAGADRQGQGQSGQAQLRRRHHHHAARRLSVQPARRHRHGVHPVQGQRRGGAGAFDRQHRFLHRRRVGEHPADQGRQAARARQAQQPAAAGAARRAAAVGRREPAGARRNFDLGRAGGASRHAAGDR